MHPDGFFAGTTYTSGVWENSHLKKLSSQNLVVIPVWSVNWLKDPVFEARKLASQIIKVDNQYGTTETLDETVEGLSGKEVKKEPPQ